jgi:hypothetical protein
VRSEVQLLSGPFPVTIALYCVARCGVFRSCTLRRYICRSFGIPLRQGIPQPFIRGRSRAAPFPLRHRRRPPRNHPDTDTCGHDQRPGCRFRRRRHGERDTPVRDRSRPASVHPETVLRGTFVIPAHAGIHVHRTQMDSRFRGNDEFQDGHSLAARRLHVRCGLACLLVAS